MTSQLTTSETLRKFDFEFPFYRAAKFYTSFQDGLIYYSFDSAGRATTALNVASALIERNHYNLKAQIVEKMINSTAEFHLIIVCKNYHYDPERKHQAHEG